MFLLSAAFAAPEYHFEPMDIHAEVVWPDSILIPTPRAAITPIIKLRDDFDRAIARVPWRGLATPTEDAVTTGLRKHLTALRQTGCLPPDGALTVGLRVRNGTVVAAHDLTGGRCATHLLGMRLPGKDVEGVWVVEPAELWTLSP